VVTQVEPLGEFYSAEEYHREYYEKNKAAPYCQIVINPKLKKLKETYAALLKETE
jgi:peptide-methionine (S)-S-oxide reductase